MTDNAQTPSSPDGEASPAPAAPFAPPPVMPVTPVAPEAAAPVDRPELPVIAAFAGGFLFANLLRRMTR